MQPLPWHCSQGEACSTWGISSSSPFPLGVNFTSSKLHSSTKKKIHKNKDILKAQKYNHPS